MIENKPARATTQEAIMTASPAQLETRTPPSCEIEWRDERLTPDGRHHCRGRIEDCGIALVFEPALHEWFFFLEIPSPQPAQMPECAVLGPFEGGRCLEDAKRSAVREVRHWYRRETV
jgi:hypothetical protein